MSDANLSLVLHGVKDLRLEDRPIPEPAPGEVQISIRCVGICGTDVTFWQHGRLGDYELTKPVVLGHEPSGVVTKLGEGVKDLSVGDRVAVEPNKPCGQCTYCKVGAYNLCKYLLYLATPPQDGCLARVCCHPAAFVHKIPDNMSFEEAALVQPLAVGMHVCRKGKVSLGQVILITGAGPLGQYVVLAAKARGASKICVTDLNQQRLDFIKSIGADLTINATNKDPEDLAKEVISALGREPDVSIECSGHWMASSTGVYATKPTGTVVLVGFGKDTDKLPLLTVVLKELKIVGSCCLANVYEAAIEAVSSGQINVTQLVTHRFPLERAVEAYEKFHSGEAVKVVIDCSRGSTCQNS